MINTIKGRILIVDDNIDTLRLLSNLLNQRGYKVRKAINGKIALMGVNAEAPDLILLDVMMPMMNGYEVCQQLKKNPKTASIPVIFLTALDDSLDKLKGFEVGGVDYITKPFQVEEVVVRIEHQLKIINLQKQLEWQYAQLQQSEKRLLTIIESMSDGLIILDKDSKVRFVNPAAQSWWNQPIDQLLNKPLNLSLRMGEIKEIEFRQPLGKVLIAEVQTEPIIWDNEPAYLVSLRDITERKQKEAAEAANRAKTAFLASMNHELRTPLNAILGFTQILQRDSTLTPQQQKYLSTIHTSGNHLLTLIDDILNLSKIEAGKMELNSHDVHLVKFLLGVTEICRIRAAKKGLTFLYQPGAQLPATIYVDEKRLRQVLINLLSNAIKFTDTGSVTFQVSVIPPETRTNNQQPTTNNKIRFHVEDTGVGIAAEELDKIFEPFEQVGDKTRKAEGTGLGLTITKKIVALMGSKLQLKSTVEVGSRFWFDLELSQISASLELAKVPPSKEIIGYQGKRKKILVLDNHWENRSALVNLLEPIGFEVQETSNSEECLAQAINLQPDLIIIDWAMVSLNSFELKRNLGELPELQQTILIASCASSSNLCQQESQALICHDFFAKPIKAKDVLEKIQNCLGLSWVYEDSPELLSKIPEYEANVPNELQIEAIIPPLAEELNVFYDLARKGLIDSLSEQAEKLKEKDERYLPFAQELQNLSQGFKMKQIREFIKQYMDS
ncbi:MAG: response regulator [Symploca sp. SIO2D2]|nr:response regulator [Symploca sp. SIO2D2]